MAEQDIFADIPKANAASPLWDVLRSAATGLRSGVEGMAGLPGDVGMGMRWLNNKAMTGLGFEDRPEYVAGEGDYAPLVPALEQPTSSAIHGATSKVLGESYKPETTGGEYARTVGEFLPGSVFGPGGLVRNAVTAGVAPGLASEAAGQMTEGSDYEPLARIAGALAGGSTAASAVTPRPAGPLTPAQMRRYQLITDMDQQNVHLPNIAMPDSGLTFLGAKLGQIPHFGHTLRRSAERTVDDLGTRLDEIADTGTLPSRTSSNYRVRDALRGWQENTSRDALTRAYDAVDQHITQPNRTTPLSNTQQVYRDVIREMGEDTTQSAASALRLVEEAALERPQGLTYQGLKRLRTEIGARLSGDIAPEPGTNQPALKRLYAALTDDLEMAVYRSGGMPARQAWQRANSEARQINAQRDVIARIIGVRGDASPDAIANRLLNMAKDTGRGDSHALVMARNAMMNNTRGQDVWTDLTRNVIARMGRDPSSPTRQFSPDRFLTSWGKMSDQGRRRLFGANYDNMNALARLSEAHRTLMRQGNPSGTGGVVTLGTIAGGLMTAPLTTLTTLAGGNGLAWMLSRRANATKVVNWARARNGFIQNRTATTGQAFLEASRQMAEALSEGTGDDPDEIMDAMMNPQTASADPFGDIPNGR